MGCDLRYLDIDKGHDCEIESGEIDVDDLKSTRINSFYQPLESISFMLLRNLNQEISLTNLVDFKIHLKEKQKKKQKEFVGLFYTFTYGYDLEFLYSIPHCSLSS